ncbi:hypothetical protein SZN_14311 [Streptomyces zinciresistens K42]|uniref:Uncharacterized protein n=1 Tax=Streptomyces zinciresistens K42 TaxID=700597 RepID=G2GBI8_9ACTN|nr:hypothetical protein SZN_14311 [Streptomyces zinciresistens K42]
MATESPRVAGAVATVDGDGSGVGDGAGAGMTALFIEVIWIT